MESPLVYTVVRKTWLSKKLGSQPVIVAFLATVVLAMGSLIYESGVLNAQLWGVASYSKVFEQHELWRAWTTLFVHADGGHLLSNAFLFFILGVFLNGHFGYFIFPTLALIVGGLTNLIVLRDMPPETNLIGASGIVFWMGGFWLVLYSLLDTRRTHAQRALRAVGVGLALFMPAEAFDPHISYQAHLVGFILGLGFGFVYYFFNRTKFLKAERKQTIVEDTTDEYRVLS